MKSSSMFSLLGGALAGAAAMYLLDPEAGQRRRKRIAAQAGDCIDGTRDLLHTGWDKVSDYAGDLGHTLADKAHQYGSRMPNLSHLASPHVPTPRDIRENLTDYSNTLWNQLRNTGHNMRSRARKQARSYLGQTSPALPVTLTAIGCCAVGAAIMYLADPRLGRARRAWLTDKSASFANRTSRSLYRTGRHMANKAKGVVAETRGAGQDLVERVQSSIRGMLNNPNDVQVSSDVSGTVTLVGRLAAEQCDRILQIVESVPGVRSVVNRIERIGSPMSHPTTQRNQGVPLM